GDIILPILLPIIRLPANMGPRKKNECPHSTILFISNLFTTEEISCALDKVDVEKALESLGARSVYETSAFCNMGKHNFLIWHSRVIHIVLFALIWFGLNY
ncbi:hypothetical protein ACJX0J_014179, partial [Zea mays]